MEGEYCRGNAKRDKVVPWSIQKRAVSLKQSKRREGLSLLPIGKIHRKNQIPCCRKSQEFITTPEASFQKKRDFSRTEQKNADATKRGKTGGYDLFNEWYSTTCRTPYCGGVPIEPAKIRRPKSNNALKG